MILLFSNSAKMEEKEKIEVKKEDIVKIKPNLAELENYEGNINDLHILHPAFRNKVITLIYECKKRGIELKVIETYRSHKRQNKFKRRGSTMLSGGYSKHQHFLAIDLAPVNKNGKIMWNNKKLWKIIGKIGKEQGLIWGGSWKMRDYNHFEYNCSINEVNNIPIPDTVLIPLNY